MAAKLYRIELTPRAVPAFPEPIIDLNPPARFNRAKPGPAERMLEDDQAAQLRSEGWSVTLVSAPPKPTVTIAAPLAPGGE